MKLSAFELVAAAWNRINCKWTQFFYDREITTMLFRGLHAQHVVKIQDAQHAKKKEVEKDRVARGLPRHVFAAPGAEDKKPEPVDTRAPEAIKASTNFMLDRIRPQCVGKPELPAAA